MITPRVGGIVKFGTSDIPWTGGSNLEETKRTVPVSLFAMRPMSSLEDARNAIFDIRQGFSNGQLLKTPEETTKDSTNMSFAQWARQVRYLAEEKGIDTVFRMVKTDTTTGIQTETYLLEEWKESLKTENVRAWVTELENGVGESTTPDSFDIYNLRESGKFLINTLDSALWSIVESSLGPKNELSGPMIFAEVASLHLSASFFFVQAMESELQQLSLANEPGENVETFAAKVADLAHRIDGTGLASNHFPVLVARCFLHSRRLPPAFRMQAESIYNRACNNGEKLTFREIIDEILRSYRWYGDRIGKGK